MQPLEQGRAPVVVEQFVRRDQPTRLRSQGLDDDRVGVAEDGDADAGGAVDVLAAVSVPHPRALAPDEGDRTLVVQAGRMPVFTRDDVLRLQ